MKIKLSELRQMVKSVIKEETPASAVNKYPTPVTKKFVTASWNGEYKVTQEYLAPNGVVFIKTDKGNPDLTFHCKDKQFYLGKTIVSNLEYTKELQSRFCANINKIYPAGGGSGASSGGGLGASIDKIRPLIQEVRFYNNSKEESNQYDLVLNITQTFVDKDKTKVILKTNKGDYSFKCTKDKSNNHYIGIIKDGLLPSVPMYNKAYTTKLASVYCTTSAGGSDVINIGTYSQTDQKQPMNVAESKLRKIVKAIIKEERDCGCSK
jgi:hypothetical protein